MNTENIKNRIDIFLDQNMVFVAKRLCEKLLMLEGNEYWKFRYADILRLCTLFDQSKEIFLALVIQKIPEKYRSFYYMRLGHLYMDMGEIEMAKKEFIKCMEFESSDSIPYIYMATLLLGEKNNDEAIAYLSKAVNKGGPIDEVYYNLATRYMVKGAFKDALIAIDKCLGIDPNYPNAEVIRKDIKEYKRQNR